MFPRNVIIIGGCFIGSRLSALAFQEAFGSHAAYIEQKAQKFDPVKAIETLKISAPKIEFPKIDPCDFYREKNPLLRKGGTQNPGFKKYGRR